MRGNCELIQVTESDHPMSHLMSSSFISSSNSIKHTNYPTQDEEDQNDKQNNNLSFERKEQNETNQPQELDWLDDLLFISQEDSTSPPLDSSSKSSFSLILSSSLTLTTDHKNETIFPISSNLQFPFPHLYFISTNHSDILNDEYTIVLSFKPQYRTIQDISDKLCDAFNVDSSLSKFDRICHLLHQFLNQRYTV